MDGMKWEQRRRKMVTFLLVLLVVSFSGTLWHNCVYVANYDQQHPVAVQSRWRWYHDLDAAAASDSSSSSVAVPSFASSSEDEAPYNLSALPPNDLDVLVDLRSFRFHINSHACDNVSELFLMVFVHSAPAHADRRRAIRETWGREDNLPGRSMRVVFLLGESASAELQAAIEAEQQRHGDLVQGNFVDSYRNLTYKHVMGLKWVSYFCQQALYVLKADDDVFVDTTQLAHYARVTFGALRAPRRLMFCFTYEQPYVKRSRRSKWYVSFREFPAHYYPTYCAGWSIMMSPDVIFDLYVESARYPYFWVDDVHITGVLASKLGIKHRSFNGFLEMTEAKVHEWLKKDDDIYPLMFSYPDASSDVIYKMWNKTKRFYERIRSR